MQSQNADRELDFTTIRITKKDKQLLSDLALPGESAWETFRRIAQAAAMNKIKKKEEVKNDKIIPQAMHLCKSAHVAAYTPIPVP